MKASLKKVHKKTVSLLDLRNRIDDHMRRLKTVCNLLSLYGLRDEASPQVTVDTAHLLLDDLDGLKASLNQLWKPPHD